MILGQGVRVMLPLDEGHGSRRCTGYCEPADVVRMVYPTAGLVVTAAEHDVSYPGIENMKFLPDGRLVDKNALGAYQMGAIPILTTWPTTKTHWASVITDTNNLNNQITAWYKTGKLNAAQLALVNGWVAFRDNVYGDYSNLARWTSTELASTAYERADARLSELAEWRQRFEALSGQSALPGSKPGGGPGVDPTTIVKYVAVAAGVAAVAWLGVTIITRVKAPVRA